MAPTPGSERAVKVKETECQHRNKLFERHIFWINKLMGNEGRNECVLYFLCIFWKTRDNFIIITF